MSMNLGHLIAHIGADNTQFIAAMGAAQTKMAATAMSMKKSGKMLSMALTLPLVAIGGAAFKMSKDFETSMSKITGLVGVSSEQVEAWGKTIQELGPKVAQGPEKLADALFFITSAGIKGAEAMEVLEMSAKAASSGLGDTAVVADLVTSAMNAYGKENLNAATATDILVATVREGKAAPEELAQALGQVLPIASEMGVTFDQVGAAIAAMTRTGTNAATAAMQLKQILASMLKPAIAAEKAMEAMGVSSKHFRDVIKKDGVLAALQELKELQGKYGEQTIANVIPNIRALSGVLDLVGKNGKDNAVIFDKLTNTTGALDDAFSEASKTADFRMNAALSKMSAGMIDVGNIVTMVFVPAFEAIADVIGGMLHWFGDLSEGGKKVAAVLGTLAAAAGPVLLVLGYMIDTIIPKLILGMKGVGNAILWVNKVILANPYLAAGAALLALVAAVIYYTKENKAAATSQLDLSNGLSLTTDSIDKQSASLNLLFIKLKKTKKGTEERSALINTINAQYGKYLPKLLTEKSTLQEISKAQEDANTGLANSIMIKAKSLEQEKLLATTQKEQRELLKSIALFEGKEGANKLIAQAKYLASLDKTSGAYSSYIEQHKNGAGYLIGTDAQVVALSESFRKQKEGLQQIDSAYNLLIGTLDKVITEVDDLSNSTGGTGAAIKIPVELELSEAQDLDFEEIPDSMSDILIPPPSVDEQAWNDAMSTVMKNNTKMAATVEAGGMLITDKLGALKESMNSILEQGVESLIMGMADSTAAMLSGTGTMTDFLGMVLSTIGSFAQQMGATLIAYGVAMDAFTKAFTNPYAAIAAGAALLVLGGMVKSYAEGGLQGLATGGKVTSGGNFMVGENGPEMVKLNAGNAVIPNHALNQGSTADGGVLEARISGDDLLILLNRATSKSNRY